MDTQEVTFGPKTYLLWRKEIDVANIMDQTMWQTAYQKVHEYSAKEGLTIAGPGAALYFRWDEPKGRGEIGIGNPVTTAGRDTHAVHDSDLSIVAVSESKAVLLRVSGAYTNFPEHHRKLTNYLKEKNTAATLVIEEYVTTGMDTPHPSDCKTNIYHLYA